MNTSKVFTGFDNNDNELLIYRENSDSYIDLINKERLNQNDFDLESLRFLRDTIKVCGYLPEELIKKIYLKDRKSLVQSDKFLLGIKGTISDLEEKKEESGFYYYGVPIHDYHYEWKLCNKELGLYTFSKKVIYGRNFNYNIYKNVNDGNFYIGFNGMAKNISQLPVFGEGMEYVCLNKKTLKNAVNEPVIEKKKVYEIANQARKERVH